MAVLIVAVAQVHPDRDVRGHEIHTTREANDDRVEAPRRRRGEAAYEDPELHGDVALGGDPLMRECSQQTGQVTGQGALVGRLDAVLVLGDHQALTEARPAVCQNFCSW